MKWNCHKWSGHGWSPLKELAWLEATAYLQAAWVKAGALFARAQGKAETMGHEGMRA